MVGLRPFMVMLAPEQSKAIRNLEVIPVKESFSVMRFSKKVIIFTMGATIVYAIVYMILCFMIQQLPDYSFNAGIFAALSAENLCNAWIKVWEHKSKQTSNQLNPDEETGDSVFHPNELTGENINVGD